jgi:hypothetical protein
MEYPEYYVTCTTVVTDCCVSVTVVAINDPPQVDLGGVSENDMLQFREQQTTGIHIISLPHRLQLGDLENHLISSVSIALKFYSVFESVRTLVLAN